MLAPATVIDEKFEVLRTIGCGGMGVVYEATQLGFNRTVAFKILTNSLPESTEDLARFEREAVILSRLLHPNIVQFYSYGTWREQPYIAMERLHGTSLQQLISASGKLEPRVAVRFAQQICDGLAHAHANGVIHRDLKPSNIILVDGPGGQKIPKMVDFGLAKISGLEKQAQKLTQTGTAIGSILYMSPEQCLGQSVDDRADVYSLGCTLYEMLTGMPPYVGATGASVMFQHVNDSISGSGGWSTIPERLQEIIGHCSAKSPSDRYPNIVAVKEDLERALKAMDSHFPAMAVSRRMSLRRIAIPLALLLLGAVAAAVLKSAHRAPSASDYGPKRDLIYLLAHRKGVFTTPEQYKEGVQALKQYKATASSPDHNLLLNAYHQIVLFHHIHSHWRQVLVWTQRAFEDCDGSSRYDLMNELITFESVAYHKLRTRESTLIPKLARWSERFSKASLEERAPLDIETANEYCTVGRFDESRDLLVAIIRKTTLEAQRVKAIGCLLRCERVRRSDRKEPVIDIATADLPQAGGVEAVLAAGASLPPGTKIEWKGTPTRLEVEDRSLYLGDRLLPVLNKGQWNLTNKQKEALGEYIGQGLFIDEAAFLDYLREVLNLGRTQVTLRLNLEPTAQGRPYLDISAFGHKPLRILVPFKNYKVTPDMG